jgi:hypothetical protein
LTLYFHKSSPRLINNPSSQRERVRPALRVIDLKNLS